LFLKKSTRRKSVIASLNSPCKYNALACAKVSETDCEIEGISKLKIAICRNKNFFKFIKY
jgi:hypothetical protein